MENTKAFTLTFSSPIPYVDVKMAKIKCKNYSAQNMFSIRLLALIMLAKSTLHIAFAKNIKNLQLSTNT